MGTYRKGLPPWPVKRSKEELHQQRCADLILSRKYQLQIYVLSHLVGFLQRIFQNDIQGC